MGNTGNCSRVLPLIWMLSFEICRYAVTAKRIAAKVITSVLGLPFNTMTRAGTNCKCTIMSWKPRPQVLSFQSLYQVMGRNTSKVKKFLVHKVVYSQCFPDRSVAFIWNYCFIQGEKINWFHGVCFRFKIERNRRLSVCSWCSYSSCSLPLNATLHGTSTTKGTTKL